MIDTWATVGSCAQIGRDCHISGGAGIGGVLEPLQANPTIIEDNCFIGACSEVAEGVIVGEGSVISMWALLPQRLDADHRSQDRAKCIAGSCRPIRWSWPAASACPAAADDSVGQLRDHHEDGGRPDALEDLGQRAAAGLKNPLIPAKAGIQGFCSSALVRSARATTKDTKRRAGPFVLFVSFVVKSEKSLGPRLRGDERSGWG